MLNNSQDVVENNNNEAQSASKSQVPPAINSAEGNSPPTQQEGESQGGGTAGSSKEMVIHPAFSGPKATDPNPKLARIFEVQEEQRVAKKLKRIRSRTSASEAASNSSSVNIGLPEESELRLSDYKSMAFVASDIEASRENCRFIIDNLHCMLGEAHIGNHLLTHMTMDGDVLGVNDNDILLKSKVGQSSYSHFKDVLCEVTTLAQAVNFFQLSEALFSN
ncbi:hypothetical protein PPACK8108_LOCUS538, partial [Phakopsora pachyrhizi]